MLAFEAKANALVSDSEASFFHHSGPSLNDIFDVDFDMPHASFKLSSFLFQYHVIIVMSENIGSKFPVLTQSVVVKKLSRSATLVALASTFARHDNMGANRAPPQNALLCLVLGHSLLLIRS